MSNYWMNGNTSGSSCGSGGCSGGSCSSGGCGCGCGSNCTDPCVDPCIECCGDRVIEISHDLDTGEGEYLVVPGDKRPEFKIITYDNFQVIEDNDDNTYTVCKRDGSDCFTINTRWSDITNNGDNTYEVCANQGDGPCFTIDADYQVIDDNGDGSYTVCDKSGGNCFTIDTRDKHTLTNDGDNRITDTHNGDAKSCDIVTDVQFITNNNGDLEVDVNGVPGILDPDLLPNCTCKGPWRMGDTIDLSSCLGGKDMPGSKFTRYNVRLELISDPSGEFSTNTADISSTTDQNASSSAAFESGIKKHAYSRLTHVSGSRYYLEAAFVERDTTAGSTGATGWQNMGEHHVASISFGSMFGGSLPSVPTRDVSPTSNVVFEQSTIKATPS